MLEIVRHFCLLFFSHATPRWCWALAYAFFADFLFPNKARFVRGDFAGDDDDG